MSCLSKSHRLKTQKEFDRLYKSGKKWHTHSFVAFFRSEKDQELSKFAFVASKKVGNAVARNKAKRKLRASLLQFEDKIKCGSYIFIAKDTILEKTIQDINKDFNFALKRMELYK